MASGISLFEIPHFDYTMRLPPVIQTLPDGTERPLWSVMIPVYNCSSYLPSTLQSVLEQDPGREVMQIEVVDDASSDADVSALVERIEAAIAAAASPLRRVIEEQATA